MNPLLIASAAQAGGDLLSSFMNTSSAQAINAQNLQQQAFSAGGGYLPQLALNAQKIGVNPLAVLGYHAPSMAVQTPTDPGAGIGRAGAHIAEMLDAGHAQRMNEIAEKQGTANILKTMSEASAAKTSAAKDQIAVDLLSKPASWIHAGESWMQKAGQGVADYVHRITIPRWIGDPAAKAEYDLSAGAVGGR